MRHSHQSRSKSHGETRTFGHSRSVGVNFGTSTTEGVSVGAGHVDDLVEREAHSLAAQISRLADVLTVTEFCSLRIKLDSEFDRLLFGQQSE